MRGNAHVRFGGRAGETHITRVAQGAPVRPYYVKAGLEKEKAALLVVIGAMSDGRKEVLTIVPGYRESKESVKTRPIRQTIPPRMPRRRRYPRAEDTLFQMAQKCSLCVIHGAMGKDELQAILDAGRQGIRSQGSRSELS